MPVACAIGLERCLYKKQAEVLENYMTVVIHPEHERLLQAMREMEQALFGRYKDAA